MPGPPKKPTSLKILEGNRGHRPLDLEAEPQPLKGLPEPEGLPADARRIWDEIVPELDRLNLLTMVDGVSLESACRGAANARAADAEVEKCMDKIRAGEANQETYYRLSMLNSVSKKGWQQWKTFATEFGLTPASRSRINLAALNPGDKAKGGAKRMDPIEAALCGGSRLQA
jgi:P27 family predicted phage terminase small subunit